MPRMQQRRDSAANWASVNPILAAGEIAVETPSRKFKIGDGTSHWNALGYSGVAGYHLSATTTDATPTKLTGDSLALENGEAWQFEVKLVAQNKKTSGTKVWSIRGGIKRSFAGAVSIIGSLDTQTTGSTGGGSVSVTADAATQGLAITVTGLSTAQVDWQATVLTSERTSTQQAQIGGCTDPDVSNYNSAADYDDGSCSYNPVPSSAALEPIASVDPITSIAVTVGSNSLYPAFDLGIHDYCVSTSAAYLGSVSYSVTINDGEPIEGTAKAGRTLQINDGTNYYYVRLLPSDVVVGSVEYGPTEGYVPGYYLTGKSQGGSDGPYYYIYDHRGVPLWYGRSPSATPLSAHAGRYANRIVGNPYGSQGRSVLQLNAASVSRATYNTVASAAYGTPSWDLHETRELALPAERSGSIFGAGYNQGFYLQEQSASGELIWEWHSKEYFTSQDPEYYHFNSADVHPVTGNIIVSLRNCSAVLCIDYVTKNILWVLQGDPSPSYGTLQATAISGATENTKWLTISGEPSVDGFQYNGTRAQHDARWHDDSLASISGRKVFSVYDNQSTDHFGFTTSGAGPASRGVVYEVDEATGVAYHLSSVFSETGVSQFSGSYTLLHDGGEYSHTLNLTTQHPSVVEWVGAIDGAKTKVWSLDLPDNHYRIVKVPTSQFRLDNLRATCGVNVDTGALPAAQGGGGTSLLLHFDGEDGSTTFTDSSANGMAVTANDSVQISTAESKFGGASGYFSGGYLSTPYNPGLAFGGSDFTIEWQMYWTGGNDIFSWSNDYRIGMLADYAAASGNYLCLFASTTGSAWDIFTVDYGGGASGVTSIAAPKNQWCHVAITRSGATWRIFIDGVEAFNGTSSDSLADPSGLDFCVGGWWAGLTRGLDFQGYIDEFRVTNGAALYTTDFTPPSSPFTS